MNVTTITGKVISDIKIINTKNGSPFCRFTLLAEGHNLNCLVAGKKAFSFLYEVTIDTDIIIKFTLNERDQLVVRDFKVLNSNNYLNQLFEYKGRKIPHKKAVR